MEIRKLFLDFEVINDDIVESEDFRLSFLLSVDNSIGLTDLPLSSMRTVPSLDIGETVSIEDTIDISIFFQFLASKDILLRLLYRFLYGCFRDQ